MNTEVTDIKLPTSIWRLLRKVDNLFSQPLSWTEHLEEVNQSILELLELDAIWLLTLPPLPTTACGLLQTPLPIAPAAQIRLVDHAPPIEDILAAGNGRLPQIMAAKAPCFSRNDPLDLDLGNLLFNIFGLTTTAVVPLLADDHCVGLLIVAGYKNSLLSAEAQNLLTYLGQQYLGGHLRNVCTFKRSRRHATSLISLNQIAQTITSSLDIEEVIRRTMAGINQLLDVEAGSLLLLDKQNDELYFKITLRGENDQVSALRLKSNEGLAGWTMTHNRPVISNDVRRDKRFYAKVDETIGFVTKTLLCVPLIVQGKPIGVIELLNKRNGLFDEDDQELLVLIAATLGIALQNTNLYEALQERARRTEAINQVTSAINTGRGLLETGKIIFEQFGRLFAFHHLSVSLLDSSKENIRQWIFNEYGSIEQTKKPIPLSPSALAGLIAQNQSHISPDISKSQRYPDQRILFEDKIKSALSVLLTTQKGPYGSLNLGHRAVGIYTATELNLLEQFIPQVAVAIEKAYLIDMMEQQTNELHMLNRLGEMLVSTTDIRRIVDTTLSMLPRLLPGDIQGIVAAGEEGAYLGVAVPFGFLQTEAIIQEIFQTYLQLSDPKTPVELISARDIAGNMPVSANWEAVTVLSWPILTRRGVLGIIYMASGQVEKLTDDRLHTFSLVVSQTSVAIENATLFQEVEQERARLSAFLTSSTDAILVVNRSGRIVLDNPASRKVMGVSESQSGHSLAESTTNTTLIDLFESAMAGGESTGEIPLQDGRTFFANLSPVAVEGAGIIGWVAAMQDVSRFKELNQLKNDFVNNVSHDLRSPLSGITIATHLLRRVGPTNESQQELLNTIDSRVQGMADLIDELLDVGKIEAGIDMEMDICYLGPMINEVVASLLPQAHDKSIALSHTLEQGLPAVMANIVRLRQVMHNLVGNAIKYTPNEGTVKVHAFAHEHEIRIQVVDTGLGIPAADQPHIFEKFYRVRGDHVVSIKGTGLGLALVKSIVEKHQGRVWLESVFGEGSTFTVALPVYSKPPSLEGTF